MGKFRGFAPNPGNLMKQAQKMQREMQQIQEEMQSKTWSATTGGGMVTATVNGKHELVGLVVHQDVIDPNEAEMMQDMIMAATNEAMRKSQEEVEANMARFSAGFNLGF